MAIQFIPVRIKDGRSPEKEKAEKLILWGKIFDRLWMTPYVDGKGSAGNMGFRSSRGICVTSSGSSLGALSAGNIMTVVDVKEDKGSVSVYFYGALKKFPTSETLIYWDIFRNRPDVNVVLHGHDSLCLEKTSEMQKIFRNDVAVTSAVTEAGSLEFRKNMQDILPSGKTYLVGRGHGFFALGSTFDEAGLSALKFRTEALNLLIGKQHIERLKKKYDLS